MQLLLALVMQQSIRDMSRWLRMFYTESVHVPVKCHAIDRSRWVMCSAFDWPLLNRNDEPPRFYPQEFVQQLPPLLFEGLKKTNQGIPCPM
jgi:hypothetical protein